MTTVVASEPTPQCGDVIFILSSGKLSYLSCVLQRAIFDTGKTSGPWFSHVAIVLNDSVALEASTPPDANDPPLWSGAQLEQGVRLIMIPDLLLTAKRRAVLRYQGKALIQKNEFDVSAPHIAAWYGSEYSIRVLKESAETAVPLLTKIVPSSLFDWSSPPDDLATKLNIDRLAPQIAKTIPNYKFPFQRQSFFCSQLVTVLLWHAGLLANRPEFQRLTPSGLFNVLCREKWIDVTETDYGDAALHAWSRTDPVEWEIQYLAQVGLIKWWREHYATKVTGEVIEEMLQDFAERKDKQIDRLNSFR